MQYARTQQHPELIATNPFLSNFAILEAEDDDSVPGDSLADNVLGTDPESVRPLSGAFVSKADYDAISRFEDIVNLRTHRRAAGAAGGTHTVKSGDSFQLSFRAVNGAIRKKHAIDQVFSIAV